MVARLTLRGAENLTLYKVKDVKMLDKFVCIIYGGKYVGYFNYSEVLALVTEEEKR